MRHVQSAPTPKLPKTAVDRQEHHGNGTPGAPGVPRNATYEPTCLEAGHSDWALTIP